VRVSSTESESSRFPRRGESAVRYGKKCGDMRAVRSLQAPSTIAGLLCTYSHTCPTVVAYKPGRVCVGPAPCRNVTRQVAVVRCVWWRYGRCSYDGQPSVC